jgi:hypothetical protein
MSVRQPTHQFEAVGHFIIFGPTYSGKTHYAKHLITQLAPTKVFVFAGEPYQWAEPGFHVQDEAFEIAAVKIFEECSEYMKANRGKPDCAACPFLVIFDDYNEEINTSHNENYKKLYTKGRHSGIRVINMAHFTRAIGPVARTNVRYISFMCTTPDDEVKLIADAWFDKDYFSLKRKVKTCLQSSRYNVLVIDRITKSVNVSKAPAPLPTPSTAVTVPSNDNNVQDRIAKNMQTLMNMPTSFREHSATKEVTVPDNASIFTNPESLLVDNIGSGPSVGDTNVGGTLNVGNKSAHNMLDQSNNVFNIDHRIKMDQRVESNNINNQMKMQNVKVNNTITLYQHVHDTRDLIYKPFKTQEEITKIIYVLNRTLRPNIKYTVRDYKEGIPIFLKHYFQEHYDEDEESEDELEDKILNVAVTGFDTMSIAAQAIGMFKNIRENRQKRLK